MADLEAIDLPSILSPERMDSCKNRKPVELMRKTGRVVRSVPQVCEVCLGKATGHHYEVASCNACKSFFRRVITGTVIHTCLSENSCYDNLSPGDPAPKCRSCRFKKCVKVGMNPLAIQSEHRRLQEKDSDGELVLLPKIIAPPKSVELQISELIDNLVYLDLKTSSFRTCSYNPQVFPTLQEVVKEEISILSIADRMGPMPGWPIPPETIKEYQSRASAPRTMFQNPPPYMKRWASYDMLTIIEMTKTFDFFRKLSERDRYLLFRDTLLMAANLTLSYFSVEKGSDEMLFPDGTTPPSKPPEWMPAEIHYRCFADISKRAIAGLIQKKMTKTEYLLIRAVLLCNAAAPEISKEAREILFVERKKYTMALLNHTMAGHGSGGPGRFAELLNIIDVLERQQKDQRDVHLLMSICRSNDFKVPLFDEVLLAI